MAEGPPDHVLNFPEILLGSERDRGQQMLVKDVYLSQRINNWDSFNSFRAFGRPYVSYHPPFLLLNYLMSPGGAGVSKNPGGQDNFC